MTDIERVRATPWPAEFAPGASNALRTCLRLRPDERLTIITDRETSPIAAALLEEAERIGATMSLFLLEEAGSRPLRDMPGTILADLAQSRVSIFAAQAQEGELQSRVQMCAVVNQRRIRHGHMVNISRRIMQEGMKADFLQVDRLSDAVIRRARSAGRLRATTPAGTDLEAEFSPVLRWVKTSGIIADDTWGNLPGGEVFTAPWKVNGVFVADGVVGDYLCRKYGDLRTTPLTVEIQDSRIRDVRCPDENLQRDFLSYVATDANSNRVGEIAVGTNLAVRSIIGEILQDEKYPGVHIAFGHPYAEHTGADWNSATHIDCVGRDFSVWLDEEQIMSAGVFSDDYLAAAGGNGQ
jgi:leucyl aminopeptidase (aminopeptidase T)